MTTSNLLILDATREGTPDRPADFNRALQALMAKHLSRPLEEIEQAWSAVSLVDTRLTYVPGQTYVTSLTVIECELTKVEVALAQQGKSLRGLQAIILVDDEAHGRNSVSAGLAVQLYRHTHIDPMMIGVQETGHSAWRVVDAIPEPGEVDWSITREAAFLQALCLTGTIFDHLDFSVMAKVHQVRSLGLQTAVSPDFDAACADLEELCIDTQTMLSELLTTTRLLPIHAVVTQLVPQLPQDMDEQQLWEVESIAQKVYMQARVLSDASEDAAREAALGACVQWALEQYGGTDLLDLPDNLLHLFECVLDQVGHRSFRREKSLRK